MFHRRRKAPKAMVEVGGNTVPFNKVATRWLGVGLTPSSRSRTTTRSGCRRGKRQGQGFSGSQAEWGCRRSTAERS